MQPCNWPHRHSPPPQRTSKAVCASTPTDFIVFNAHHLVRHWRHRENHMQATQLLGGWFQRFQRHAHTQELSTDGRHCVTADAREASGFYECRCGEATHIGDATGTSDRQYRIEFGVRWGQRSISSHLARWATPRAVTGIMIPTTVARARHSSQTTTYGVVRAMSSTPPEPNASTRTC